jgi:hypothetical protein
LPKIFRISLLLQFFICTTFFFASAQNAAFLPAAEDAAFLKTLSAKYEGHYKNELAALPKENRKDFEELYKMRWDNVKGVFEKKEIYTAARAQRYLDSLVAEIVKGNPSLQHVNFNCYFSRSGVPNASYIGEGIILFNMGLFTRLDNESEAAFVLCHEIAHFYLQHIENSMRRYVDALNSKDVQNKLQKIKKSEYGKRQQVDDLLKNLTFDFRRHGRDHESQADSLAVEFMNNTHFDISSSLTTLALLDSVDHETLHIDTYLQKTFNSKEYPFQKRWLQKEEGLLGGHGKIKDDDTLADSLKTHPDCKQRIQILEPLVNKYQAGARFKNVISQSTFESLKNNFSYEIIEFSYSSGNYTRSLYYALDLLQHKPGDPYIITQVGKIFNGFYAAQKTHTLGKFIDLPSPYYQPEYNLLLQFVQNLYIEDYSAIGYQFLKQYSGQFTNYAPFTEAFNTSKQISKQ